MPPRNRASRIAEAEEQYRAARAGKSPYPHSFVSQEAGKSPKRGVTRSTSSSRAKRASSNSRSAIRRPVRPVSPEPESDGEVDGDEEDLHTDPEETDEEDDLPGERFVHDHQDDGIDIEDDEEDEEDTVPVPVTVVRKRSSSTTRAAGRRARSPASSSKRFAPRVNTVARPHYDDKKAEDEAGEDTVDESRPHFAVRLPFIVLVTLLTMLISAAVIWRGGSVAPLNTIDSANPVAMGILGVLLGAVLSETDGLRPYVIKVCNIVFPKA